MRFGGKEFLILWLLNLIVAGLYVLFELALRPLRGEERSHSIVLKAGIMLLCPLVGPALVLLGWLSYRLLYKLEVHRKLEAQLSDVLFSKERIKPQMHAQEQRESNLAPMEEAVAVMDQSDLREMMMSVVRGNVQASASAIAMALESKDPEASHYAATALQSLLNGFRTSVQKNCERITAKPEGEKPEEHAVRMALAAETVELMAEFFQHRLLTEGEHRQCVALMSDLCERLLEEAPERLTIKHYEAVSMEMLAIKDYEGCRKWCMRTYAAYPEALEAYTCQLKLYYSNGEKEKFFRVLQELRSSDISIDKETLELMRVFQ